MAARAYDIVIQSEKPGDSTSLFRLMVGDKVIAKNMTAVQVHILVGDILERLVQPKDAALASSSPQRPVGF